MSESEASGSDGRYTLFTDGACLGNPGPGGWAYVLREPGGDETECADGEDATTNNRMELTAVIRGLEAVPSGAAVSLVADSEYVVKGITEWLAGWKRRGWRKADKKPVMNADLWQALDALLADRAVDAGWVRGHAGHAENERCDQLASAEAMARR